MKTFFFIKVSAHVEGVKGGLDTYSDRSRILPARDRSDLDSFGPDRVIYGRIGPSRTAALPTALSSGLSRPTSTKKVPTSDKFFARNSRAAYRWQERV